MAEGRWAKWCVKLEASFKWRAGPYFFGDKPTYAEFALLNSFRSMADMYKEFNLDECPSVKQVRATRSCTVP